MNAYWKLAAVVLALHSASCKSSDSADKWIATPMTCDPKSAVDQRDLTVMRGFCMQGGWKSKEKLRCEKGNYEVLCDTAANTGSSERWVGTGMRCDPKAVDQSELTVMRAFCMQGGWKSKEKLRCENSQYEVLCE